MTTKNPEEYEAPITEHLAELRTRLIRSIIAVLIFTIVVFTQVNIFFDIFERPLNSVFPDLTLVALTPTESF